VKYFSDFLHQLSESILTRKEIDDMELVIQWLLSAAEPIIATWNGEAKE
jgi:hypothetical protein